MPAWHWRYCCWNSPGQQCLDEVCNDMTIVVGVRFRRVGRIYHFAAEGFEDLTPGDYVIAETSRGEELGQVVIAPKEVAGEEIQSPLRAVLRRAQPWELLKREQLRRLEPDALRVCREKVAELGLPMKVVKAEYSYDGSRLAFSFAAQRRVDFRELVRILASHFRTRIELRQIGVRDEAKLMGGLGPCGRLLCCCSFLCQFSPVSIRMAKNQDLPLSPTEISGICGRLLCCLSYENEFYSQVKERLPQIGQRVLTSQGPGRVVGVNVIKETVAVELEEQRVLEFSPSELRES